MERKRLIISFSGGLTSGYMTKYLLDTLDWNEWEIAVVFANTGKEREETFRFISDCDSYFGFNTVWVEARIDPRIGKGTRHKIVDYETASRDGEPFEKLLVKYGIPNIRCKQCTRELKVNAIRSYAKNALGWKCFYTAIGIRADEAGRMSENHEKMKYLYPLITDHPVTRIDVNVFWHTQTFTLQLTSYQGNCDMCFEKSERKLITLCHEEPQRDNWWYRMEQQFSYYVSSGKKKAIKLPVRFYRQTRSIAYFMAKAEQGDFIPAIDESKILNQNKNGNSKRNTTHSDRLLRGHPG